MIYFVLIWIIVWSQIRILSFFLWLLRNATLSFWFSSFWWNPNFLLNFTVAGAECWQAPGFAKENFIHTFCFHSACISSLLIIFLLLPEPEPGFLLRLLWSWLVKLYFHSFLPPKCSGGKKLPTNRYMTSQMSKLLYELKYACKEIFISYFVSVVMGTSNHELYHNTLKIKS